MACEILKMLASLQAETRWLAFAFAILKTAFDKLKVCMGVGARLYRTANLAKRPTDLAKKD